MAGKSGTLSASGLMVVSSSPATVWKDGGGFIEAPVAFGDKGLARNGLWEEMVAIVVEARLSAAFWVRTAEAVLVHRICHNYIL